MINNPIIKAINEITSDPFLLSIFSLPFKFGLSTDETSNDFISFLIV